MSASRWYHPPEVDGALSTPGVPMRLQFHTAPAALGTRSASPFCLKVEALLRLAEVPFESVLSSPVQGPRKKLPWIVTADGRTIPDSRCILAHLRAEHGLTLPEGPIAARRLVEDHLYWSQVLFRWEHHAAEVREALFADVPAPVRPIVFAMVRRQVRRDLWGHGLSRRPMDEILELVDEDLEGLEEALGEGPYLGGDAISVTDLSAYGLLHQLLRAPWEDALTDRVRARVPLVALHDRVDEALFGAASASAHAA